VVLQTEGVDKGPTTAFKLNIPCALFPYRRFRWVKPVYGGQNSPITNLTDA